MHNMCPPNVEKKPAPLTESSCHMQVVMQSIVNIKISIIAALTVKAEGVAP